MSSRVGLLFLIATGVLAILAFADFSVSGDPVSAGAQGQEPAGQADPEKKPGADPKVDDHAGHNHDDHGHDEAAEHDDDEGHQENHDGHDHGEKKEDDHGSDEHDEHEGHEEHEDGVAHLTPAQLAMLDLRFVEVRRGTLTRALELPGQVEWNTDRTVHITPRVTGIIASVAKTLGDRVEAGDVLCSLDSREMGEARMEYLADLATFAVSQADFDREQTVFENTNKLLVMLGKKPAIDEILTGTRNLNVGSNKNRLLAKYTRMGVNRRNFKRTQALLAKKIASEADLVETQGAYEIARVDFLSTREEIRFDLDLSHLRAGRAFTLAKTEVRNAERALQILGVADEEIASLRSDSEGRDSSISRVSLRSPIGGVVVERHVTAGEMVEPGGQLYMIADPSQVWMMGRIYERDVRNVKVGQHATIGLDAFPGQLFEGVIDYVGSQLDPSTRTTDARVVLANPDGALRPGMFGRMTVFLEHDANTHSTALLLPSAALQRVRGGFVVFKEKGPGEYEQVAVKVLEQTREFAEVTGALNVGDRVAVGDTFVLKSEAGKESMGGGHSH